MNLSEVKECYVAVVRIRPDALAQLEKFTAERHKSQQKQKNSNKNCQQKPEPAFFGPADFDLLMAVPPPPLLASGPSCSSQVQIEHQALELPRCWLLPGERAADAALRFVGNLNRHLQTRAVQIPPAKSDEHLLQMPGSSSFCPSTPPPPLPPLFPLSPGQQPPPLLLVPVTALQNPEARVEPSLEFCPFATVLHAAMNYDSTVVDAHSQNQLVRVGEWISQGQCRAGPAFIHSLFTVPSSSSSSGSSSTKRSVLHCALSNESEQNPPSSRTLSFPRLLSLDKENDNSAEAQALETPTGSRKMEGFVIRRVSRKRTPPPRLQVSVKNVESEVLERRRKRGGEQGMTNGGEGEEGEEEGEEVEELFVNPLFGTNIQTRRSATAPDYFVRGRRRRIDCAKRSRRSTDLANGAALAGGIRQQRSPTEFWAQQHPLHKHAFDGNAQKIRELLVQGLDPNELDTDFWTPLHYCAFYNRLEACQCLLLDPRMDVNVPNRTGATPLHFAALNGHVYVAELILSHQLADINIRDTTGKTPLDLCAPVPKPDWQGVAFLLRQSVELRPTKMEVQLCGGPALQVEVQDVSTATAGELRSKVLEMEGLEPPTAAGAEIIFAVWLVDSRLSLQLKAEQKVQVHLDKWAEHLEKFGGIADEWMKKWEEEEEVGERERVRVVLKRDARTLLGDEQMLARKSTVVVSLLYGEAEEQFLRGMYPSHERHYLPMAAIVAHRLYGDEWPQSVDGRFLSRILPAHLVPPATDLRATHSLLSKLRQAHRPLAGLSMLQLQMRFLSFCWSLNVYGCTFFRALMLMSKPLRGSIQVYVGLNDWGMSVLNANSHRQVAAVELHKLEVKFTPNTHFLEVQGGGRKTDFVATITTHQAQLINNLLKQLKLKVQAAKSDAKQ